MVNWRKGVVNVFEKLAYTEGLKSFVSEFEVAVSNLTPEDFVHKLILNGIQLKETERGLEFIADDQELHKHGVVSDAILNILT